MLKRKRRVLAALIALSLAVLALAGCGNYVSGTSFRESEYDLSTPENAVQVWMGSMEWKREKYEDDTDGPRNSELGRDFDAFVAVSDPALFEDASGQPASDEDINGVGGLREQWNSKDWEIEFLDIQLETLSQEGDTAVVKIVGGQTRYIGKEIFGTTEYKVDDFRDKPGEITLKKIDGKWRVIKGAFVSDDEYWETQSP